jgi:hypothetical protein
MIDQLDPFSQFILFDETFTLYISCMTYIQFLFDLLRTPAANVFLCKTYDGG